MATVFPVIKVTADGETQVNSFVKVTSGEYAWEVPVPGGSVTDPGCLSRIPDPHQRI
jgi:hypothetical protein